MTTFSTKVFLGDDMLMQISWLPERELMVGFQKHDADSGPCILLDPHEALVLKSALMSQTSEKIARPKAKDLIIAPIKRDNPDREGMQISLGTYNIFLTGEAITDVAQLIWNGLQHSN